MSLFCSEVVTTLHKSCFFLYMLRETRQSIQEQKKGNIRLYYLKLWICFGLHIPATVVCGVFVVVVLFGFWWLLLFIGVVCSFVLFPLK